MRLSDLQDSKAGNGPIEPLGLERVLAFKKKQSDSQRRSEADTAAAATTDPETTGGEDRAAVSLLPGGRPPLSRTKGVGLPHRAEGMVLLLRTGTAHRAQGEQGPPPQLAQKTEH